MFLRLIIILLWFDSMSKKKGLKKKKKKEYIKLPALHPTTVVMVSSLFVNTEKHLA